MQNRQQITHDLSDALQFLIACCQTKCSYKDTTFIQNYILEKDAQYLQNLISLSIQHGILPLVYKTIKELSLEDDSIISSEFLTELKAHYMGISQQNMLMSAELIRIMKLLEENNIEALAFKGPALAQMAYGDITLRQYVDIDILVDENDAFQAGKLMSENGHIAILPLNIMRNKTCLHAAKDFSLMSKGGVHTELHWRLFEKKFNISIMSCAKEKKCQAVSINGKTVRTLQNELLLVYLCLHGAKHAFERIEWICDIDRFIRNTEVHWDNAIDIAEQSHSKRSFYLGLSLAHTLLHTTIPEELTTRIEKEDIQMLQTMTLEKMTNRKERTDFEKNRETFEYQSKLFDTKADMLRFKLYTFFKVSTTDCQTFTLPKNLKFLCIFQVIIKFYFLL